MLSAAPGPEAEIAQRIRARLDAYRQGDARQWAAFVDDDCVCAGETKALFVQPTSDPKVEIFPEDPTTFFAKGEAWRIVFRTDPKGVVTSLVFRQQGQEYVAKRLP